jgi:hypothetical protein
MPKHIETPHMGRFNTIIQWLPRNPDDEQPAAFTSWLKLLLFGP